ISLTVLPAILTLLGNRVNSLSPAFLKRRADADARPAESGFWYRLSRFVMRRPLPIACLSGLFLVVLGLPFLGITFNTVAARVLPKDSSARVAYEQVSCEFSPYRETPIFVSLDGAPPARASAVAKQVALVPGRA